MVIIESVGKIVVFLMLLLAIFLLTVKTKGKLSNRLFGIYLLIIAFDLTGFFTSKPLEYPFTRSLKTASSLLQLPLFYLYVLSACYTNFRLAPKHFLHALPFLFFFLLFLVTGFSSLSFTLFEWSGEIQYFAYIIAIFMVLKRYKTLYLENYSGADHSTYNWLFQITVLSCVAHTFVITRWFLAFSSFQEYIPYINLAISLSVLCITTFFVLKAMYRPELFKGVDINLTPSTSHPKKKHIPNQEDTEAVQKLSSFMTEHKPYLDFELTLQKLAAQIEMPERELSALINQHLGKHFFDFINEHRINDAMQLLKDPSQQELTILEILYAVGFNSKSSFYTAFKKATGQTPTAFRKNTD